MALLSGFDPTPLMPKLTIYNRAGTEIYSFTSTLLDATAARDFNLRALSGHIGLNDDTGSLSFIIDDVNESLVDSDGNVLIQEEWEVKLQVGKTVGGLYNLFYGKIKDTEVWKTDTNFSQIRINCGGLGIILNERNTSIKRFQKKSADGLTADASDTDVYASQIAKEVVTEIDHLIDKELPQISGVTANGVDILNIQNQLIDFQQTNQTFAAAISNLAASAGAVYGIDADKDFFFRLGDTTSSGIMITNDDTNAKVTGWDVTKVGLVKKERFGWRNTTLGTGYSILEGLNSNAILKDVESTNEDATLSADLKWYAIPITPTKDNISKIALKMGKTGNPSSGEAKFLLVTDNGTDAEEDSIIKEGVLSQTELRNLSGTLDWQEISFGTTPIVPNTQVYLLVKQYGDATNTFVFSYDSATGSYLDSSDGTTWTSRTGDAVVRTFSAFPITVVFEDVRAKRKYGIREKSLPFPQNSEFDHVVEALDAISDVLSIKKREYQPIEIFPPDVRIDVGKYCRLRIKDNFDRKALITGLDFNMNAVDSSNIGIDTFTVHLQEISI
jgi:hypothetical protein